MNSVLKHILIVLGISTCLFLGNQLSAQDNYYNSIGLRGGNPSGVTYKHFIGRYSVIEGIVGVNFSYNDRKKLGYTLTGLYEYHLYITEGLDWFVGAGLTVGGGNKLGILHGDVILGIEYTIPNFPLNLSVDYKPYYSPFHRETLGTKGFGFNEFGVSVRYVIQ